MSKKDQIRSGLLVCPGCGRTRSEILAVESERNAVTVDHILPRSLGGGSGRSNLLAVCGRCNEARGTVFPWSWYFIHHLIFADGWPKQRSL